MSSCHPSIIHHFIHRIIYHAPFVVVSLERKTWNIVHDIGCIIILHDILHITPLHLQYTMYIYIYTHIHPLVISHGYWNWPWQVFQLILNTHGFYRKLERITRGYQRYTGRRSWWIVMAVMWSWWKSDRFIYLYHQNYVCIYVCICDRGGLYLYHIIIKISCSPITDWPRLQAAARIIVAIENSQADGWSIIFRGRCFGPKKWLENGQTPVLEDGIIWNLELSQWILWEM